MKKDRANGGQGRQPKSLEMFNFVRLGPREMVA
jgi:hypothetical protein